MMHPETEKLQSLAEGSLDPAELAVLDSHVLGCAACQREVAEWRSLFSVLSELPQFAPSVHFADNVMRSVVLPDPWYVRVLAQAGDRLQVIAPKTTRGWTMATAFLALPFAAFAALAVWIMSKPYLTPGTMLAFASERGAEISDTVAQTALAQLLQTEVAMMVLRTLEAIEGAGIEAAGLLVAGVFVATAGSAYILYQNLFRANAQRNRRYATYSF
jgi:anti-sigma factor RsiW